MVIFFWQKLKGKQIRDALGASTFERHIRTASTSDFGPWHAEQTYALLHPINDLLRQKGLLSPASAATPAAPLIG